jgi:hypothetical protein
MKTNFLLDAQNLFLSIFHQAITPFKRILTENGQNLTILPKSTPFWKKLWILFINLNQIPYFIPFSPPDSFFIHIKIASS